MSMKLLQLHLLDGNEIDTLKGSFDNLPHTDHKDGEYRLRRYSVIGLRTSFWNAEEEAEIELLSPREFKQTEDYNKHQGGMARSFEDIEENTLQSDGMKKICLAFKHVNNLTDGQEVEIHQMRVMTLEDGKAPVSPEGVHQDGFDHIAMVGIHRQNIRGGELLVYQNRDAFAWASPDKPSPKSSPLMRYILKDGEIIFLNDRELWHNATPIEAENKREKGFGDWFILCATK